MNDTMELNRATVTVQYVNGPKPGKKLGTIKTREDEYFYVRPDMLRHFQQGETYDLGYTETQGNNGLPLRTVQKAVPVKRAAADPTENYPSRQAARRDAEPQREPPRQPQNGSGGGYYRPTSPRDAERMFVCSTLNAFIQTGRVAEDVTALTGYVDMLRQVWRATFGADDAATG